MRGVFRSAYVVVLAMLAVSQAHGQERLPGQSLFENYCERCHSRGPLSLTTPTEHFSAVMSSSGIRQHRFTLSAQDIDLLLQYLTAVREDK